MTVMSMFSMGKDSGLPEGVAAISLTVNTEDRLNISGAVFTITGAGSTITATADVSGRAYVEVASGYTYTITLTHGGTYSGDLPQKVVTESKGHYGVLFDLKLPRVKTEGTVNRIIVSTSEPTESDGEDGDLWFVYE